MKATTLLLIAFLCLGLQSKAAPVFKVNMNKETFQKGDSIQWECSLDSISKSLRLVTLQIWVENIQTGVQWRFRFPVINGYAAGALHIGQDIPEGKYAFNFLIQHDFFNVAGQLEDASKKDTALQYFALFKDKETIANTIKLNEKGQFNINALVFEDTAMFVFSNTNIKRGTPQLKITTSLDSAFTEVFPIITKFVTVGEPIEASLNTTMEQGYVLDSKKRLDFQHQKIDEVVIKAKSKKLIEDYEKDYVTPRFSSADEIVLDGLSSDEIAHSTDLFNYLMSHVPGLTYNSDGLSATRKFRWRNQDVSLFLDEYKLDDDSPIPIDPTEIALIKVFRPGSAPLGAGGNSGGTIAIYSKVGKYASLIPSAHHNRFFLHGYSPLSLDWHF